MCVEYDFAFQQCNDPLHLATDTIMYWVAASLATRARESIVS